MELMRLTINNRIYNVFSDNINTENPKIYGYIYENNHFYPLNADIFKELNKLKIGNNTKKIGDYEKDNHVYDVILDLDTNLKHYFLNGKEDYNLFINNFEDVIIADNKNIKYTENLVDKKRKNKSVTNLLMAFGLSILIGAENFIVYQLRQLINIEIEAKQSQYLSELMNNTPTLTADIMSDLIKNNKNINDNDREILLNSGIIEFASQYVNENKEFAAKLYNIILPNFTVEKKDLEAALGSWNPNNYIIDMNVNDIKQQCESYSVDVYNDIYNDIMLHEFVHLFQAEFQYPFLYEACAEMISQEYASTSTGSLITYTIDQKYIKTLMELIGSKPIAEFNFTGSIESIKKELEPYLSEIEIDKLFELFKYSSAHIPKYITQEQFDKNLQDIEKIYEKFYYNKYHCSIKANSAINEYLDENLELIDYSFNKYYFNNCNEQSYDDNLYDALNYKIATNTYHLAYNPILVQVNAEDLLNDLDFFTLKQTFYSNINLSNEEKNMLFNEELINDYIYYKRMYLNDGISENGNVKLHCNCNSINCLEKLRITNDDRCIIGSDSSDEFPYRISSIDLKYAEIVISENNCKQYASKNNFAYDDVYKKEKVERFINILSEDYSNNILNNACTNIILKEYYGIELSQKDSISMFEEKSTKILIDLIGNEPLKYYYFTGDNKLIKEKLEQISDIDINDVMQVLEQRIIDYCNVDFKVYQDLDRCLCNLYNNKNNTQYPYSDFVNTYYVPETKGYFSKSYIEKDKLSHPENYNDISFEENNNLGKSR